MLMIYIRVRMPELISGGLGLQWLEAGFRFRSEIEVRSRQWEHQILAARPVVSDKALALQLCRKEFLQRWKVETSKLFIRRKKSTVRVDGHTGGLRERDAPSWKFESLLWGISSRFPLANHFDLPGSESVFGIAQDPPMCACAFLSQDGFHRRSLWVAGITYYEVAPPPFRPPRGFLVGNISLTPKMRNNVVCYLLFGQGPASFLNCPAIFILQYWSPGNESPIAYPGGGAHLPPTSEPTHRQLRMIFSYG